MNGFEMKILSRFAFVCVRLIFGCIAAFCFSSSGAWAAGSSKCTALPPSQYTLQFPATVAVARDLPNGSQLTSWVSMSMNNFWTCVVQGSPWYTGTDFETAGIITKPGTSYKLSYNGTPFTVYATNVPGVGMALGGYINNDGVTHGPLDFPGLGYVWNDSGNAVKNGGQLIGALVKIGDITPGTVQGQLAQAFSWESASKTVLTLNPSSGVINFDMTPVVVTVLTCQTPDVNVDMGVQSPADFPSVGQTSTKSTAFKIDLNNCPGGTPVSGTSAGIIHNIQYQIDPSSGLVPNFANVAALNAGGGSATAGGVGIQLFDSTGTIFPLKTPVTLTGFDGTQATSYTIALTARYFRTGAVTPGSANATMTMTVFYQ